MADRYEPQSQDAMFARIIQRLDQQDFDSQIARGEVKAMLHAIRIETKDMISRLESLEDWRTEAKAKIAIIITIAAAGTTFGAWIIEKFFK